jgi:hypothetical protein
MSGRVKRTPVRRKADGRALARAKRNGLNKMNKTDGTIPRGSRAHVHLRHRHFTRLANKIEKLLCVANNSNLFGF